MASRRPTAEHEQQEQTATRRAVARRTDTQPRRCCIVVWKKKEKKKQKTGVEEVCGAGVAVIDARGVVSLPVAQTVHCFMGLRPSTTCLWARGGARIWAKGFPCGENKGVSTKSENWARCLGTPLGPLGSAPVLGVYLLNNKLSKRTRNSCTVKLSNR